MDLGGAVKLIAAAARAGIRRYVMVSSVNADPNAPGDDVFSVYLRAKGEADAELQASGLDYTIVRPGRLTNDAGAGRISAAERLPASGRIPRADVAATLLATLDAPNTVRKSFDLIEGETPVAEAVRAI
jgi:uncharacterized protein YbjT (DUF2867 family)